MGKLGCASKTDASFKSWLGTRNERTLANNHGQNATLFVDFVVGRHLGEPNATQPWPVPPAGRWAFWSLLLGLEHMLAIAKTETQKPCTYLVFGGRGLCRLVVQGSKSLATHGTAIPRRWPCFAHPLNSSHRPHAGNQWRPSSSKEPSKSATVIQGRLLRGGVPSILRQGCLFKAGIPVVAILVILTK